jgi:hypothetical protein
MAATAWALALVLLALYAVPATAPSPSNLSVILSGTSGGFQMHVIGLLNRMHDDSGRHPELTLQEFEERARTEKRRWDVRGRAIVAEQSAIPHLVGFAVAGAAVYVASLFLMPFVALMLMGRGIVLLPLLCLGLVVFGLIVYAPFFLIEVVLEMLDTDVWQASGWSVVLGHMCDPTEVFHVHTLTRDLYSDKTLHDLLHVSAQEYAAAVAAAATAHKPL